MNINNALVLADEMLNKHIELKSWTVKSNNRKRSFGLCNYRKKEIQLSTILTPSMSIIAITETIIHEIAHALCPNHNHDRVWKAKCIELGGDGNRCGGSNKFENGEIGRNELMQQVAKYTLTCPVCGSESHRHRKPKRSFSCGKHGRGYNVKYKLVLSQNF